GAHQVVQLIGLGISALRGNFLSRSPPLVSKPRSWNLPGSAPVAGQGRDNRHGRAGNTTGPFPTDRGASAPREAHRVPGGGALPPPRRARGAGTGGGPGPGGSGTSLRLGPRGSLRALR